MKQRLLVGFDVETWLREAGGGAPPFVVTGWAVDRGSKDRVCGGVTHKGEWWGDPPPLWVDGDIRYPAPGEIVDPVSLFLALMEIARSEEDSRIINQFIPYDWAVVAHYAGERGVDILPQIFSLYDEKRVEDIQLREMLIDLAGGSLGFVRGQVSAKGKLIKKKYSLEEAAKWRLGESLDKVTWRTGYRGLHDVPLSQWEEGAKQYVVDDVLTAIAIYRDQEREIYEDGITEVPNSREQAEAHWALHLTSTWGIRTDPKRVAKLKASLEESYHVLSAALKEVGGEPEAVEYFTPKKQERRIRYVDKKFMRANGSKNKKAITEYLQRLEDAGRVRLVRKPATEIMKKKFGDDAQGNISLEAEVLDELVLELGGDIANELPEALNLATRVLNADGRVPEEAGLALLAWHTSIQKVLRTYVPPAIQGTKYPVQPRINPILNTGRVSYSNPNLQNLPKAPGVRECYIPRPGFLLCSVDYEALELHTLAQVCLELLGESRLAEMLNAGVDVHLAFACEHFMPHIAYEDAKKIRKNETHELYKFVKGLRDMCKAVLFGAMGGLGARSLCKYLKGYGILRTEEECKDILEKYRLFLPEMPKYFKKISYSLQEDDEGEQWASVEQVFTGRLRGKARYTAACNQFPQGLGADVAKRGLYLLSRACYTEKKSVLYGSRPVVFVHDENILEHPRATAHERAYEQARIMCDAGKDLLPDVPLKAEPALMEFWAKEAVAQFDDSPQMVKKYGEKGKLIAWKPKEKQTKP